MADPAPPTLRSERLVLEPLSVAHADELAPVLDDPALHTFIGGRPATPTELRGRYERQAAGRSPDGSERWLNWVVRRVEDGAPVGTVQATVRGDVAEVAWVVAPARQGRGYAREAATTMVDWLLADGAHRVVAHVHPDHAASAAVARATGLEPTDVIHGGEVLWQR